MSKPSILLIPGSFALPSFYDVVVDAVAKDYSIKALHLPSVGLGPRKPREGAPPSMYDDAAFIAKEAEKLADEGKDVILVAHSYGGVPVSESTKGLSIKDRKAQGKKGGIVNLAYMTVLLPAVGTSAAGVLADVPSENRLNPEIDEKGWMHQDPVAAAPVTFSDIPLEEGIAFMKQFPCHSAVSFSNELTHAGYKDIPSSYLFCEEDLVIPPKSQQDGIDLIEKVSGKKVEVTRIKFGHCPPMSAPQDVIDWIVGVAKKA